MDKPYYLKAEALGIRFYPSSRTSLEHKNVLKYLVAFCYEKFSNMINYDHLSLAIPRINLPLVWNNKRYDISFIFGDRLVLVRVDTFKFVPSEGLEEVKDGKAQG